MRRDTPMTTFAILLFLAFALLAVPAALAATTYLEPNGTVASAWTCNGTDCGIGHFAVLDDGIRFPTAPNVTDNVYTAAGGNTLAEYRSANDLSYSGVTSITLWVYASSGSNAQNTLTLTNNGTVVDTAVLPVAFGPAWAQLNWTNTTLRGNLTVGFNHIKSGGGATQPAWVHAVYWQINTSGAAAVSSPANQTVELGNSSTITWNINGTGGFFYVTRNGTLFSGPTAWSGATNVIVPANNFFLGLWNYTMYFNETSTGTNGSSSTFVFVNDTVFPSCSDVQSSSGAGAQANITIDGNMNDWFTVLSNPQNSGSDLTVIDDDPDVPETADRDLVRFAYVSDPTNLYFYFKRTVSGKNQVSMLVYLDKDLDGDMDTNDKVLKFVWSGSNRQYNSDLYNYIPSGAADNLTGDGADMPGTITLNATLDTGILGGADPGTQLETKVTWAQLGYSSPVPLNMQPATAQGSGTNLPSQLIDNGNFSTSNSSFILFQPSREQSTSNGSVVYYAHDIRNCGIGSTTVRFTNISSQGWNVTLYHPYSNETRILDTNADGNPDITLSGDSFTTIIVRVAVPASATGGTVDVSNITAIASSNNKTVTDTTSISDIGLTPNEYKITGAGNQTMIVSFTAVNSQAFNDTLLINTTSVLGWNRTITFANGTNISDTNGDGSPDLGMFLASQSKDILVSVKIPNGATVDSTDLVRVFINSSITQSRSDVSTINITVKNRLDLTPTSYNDTVNPGTTSFYSFIIINNGNGSDTFDLSYRSTLGWNVTFASSSNIPLTDTDSDGVVDTGVLAGSGANVSIYALVTAPLNVTIGVADFTRIFVNSSDNPTITRNATINTSLRGINTFNNSGRTSLDNVFLVGETAYLRAFNMNSFSTVFFIWFDGFNVSRRSANITVSGGLADDELALNNSVRLDTWTVIVYNSSNEQEIARTYFNYSDINAPNVTALAPQNNTNATILQPIELRANMTDDHSTANMSANITYPNGTIVNVALGNFSTFFNTSFSIPNLTGRYNVTFIGNDTTGNINANATTFFTVNTGVLLNIYDQVDARGGSVTFFENTQGNFYANYTNFTNGAVLNASLCAIRFQVAPLGHNITGPFNMTYNATANRFVYNTTFETPGTYDWNVSCASNVSQQANATDNVTITTSTTPAFELKRFVYNISGCSNVSCNITGGELIGSFTANQNISLGNRDPYRMIIQLVQTGNGKSWAIDPSVGTATRETSLPSGMGVGSDNNSIWDEVGSYEGTITDQNAADGGTYSSTTLTWNPAAAIAITGNDQLQFVNFSYIFKGNGVTGNHTVTFRAELDVAGTDPTITNSFNWFNQVVTDTLAPAITLIAPTDGVNAAQTYYNFTWNATDNLNTTLNCNITVNGVVNVSNIVVTSGVIANRTIAGFVDGNHTWNITCTDGTNVNTSATRSFIVDTVAPTITNLTTNATLPFVTNGTGQNITIQFNSSEYPINITITIYNVTGQPVNITGPFLINNSGQLPINFTIPGGLLDGNYTINMSVADIANNTNNTFVGRFKVDSNAPGITLNFPPAAYNTTNTSINFTWTTTDINLTMSCNLTINGVVNISNIQSFNNTATNRSIYNFSDGVYSWNITCFDGRNANTSQTRTFTIDTTPPVVTILSPVAGTNYTVNGTVNITANISDTVGGDVGIANVTLPNGTILQVVLVRIGTTFQGNFSELLQNGRYNITIAINDTLGNLNISTTYFIRPALAIIDVIDEFGNPHRFNITMLANDSGLVTLLVKPHNTSVTEVVLFNHSETSPYSVLRIRNDSADRTGFWARSWGVDIQFINVTRANVTFTARGNYLFKCTNYNLTNGTCDDISNYTQERIDLVVGQNYTIELTMGDPGFTETISGPENTSDAYLNSGSPTANQGGAASMIVGRRTPGGIFRGIVKFNLTNIPSGVRIDNATLRLYFETDTDAPGTLTHMVHRVNQSPRRDWIENNVTWNNYNSSSTWTTAGGDFVATESANATFGAAALNTFIQYNVTSDVQGFIDNTTSNFGWIVKERFEASNNQRREYASSESLNASRYPQLVVNFTDISPPAVSNVTPFNTVNSSGDTIRIRANVTDNIAVDRVRANITLPNGTVTLINLSFVNGFTYEANFTGTTLTGLYNITIIANDTSDLINNTGLGNFTIGANIAPAVTLVFPTNGTNATTTEYNFTWNATDDNNLTFICNLTINGVVNVSGINVTNATLANYSITGFDDGIHYWNVTCSDGVLTNASGTNRFTVDTTAPRLDNRTEAPQSGVGYSSGRSYNFTINVTDALNAVDVVNLTFNNVSYIATRVGDRFNATLYDLPAGTHNYSWLANDSIGNFNSTPTFTFIVNKAAATVNLSLNGTAGNLTIPQNGVINITGTRLNGSGAIELLNGTMIFNSGTSPLSNLTTFPNTGTFVFTTRYNETQNYSSANVSYTLIVTTDTVPPAITLIDPANAVNATQTYYNFSWNATDNINTTFTCSLMINSVTNISNISVTNGTITNRTVAGFADGNHTWNVTCTDGANSNTSTTRSFIVDTSGPRLDNRTEAPQSGVGYSSGRSYNFTINVTDALSAVNNVTLIFNNVSYLATRNGFRYNATLYDLPAGTHNYSWIAYDTLNNSNSTGTFTFIVNKAAPTINLTLNVSQSNITIFQNGTINITGNLTNGTGTLELFNGTMLFNNGTSPLINQTTFPNTGTFGFTLRFNATQNFSSTNVTYYVIVTALDNDAPAITLNFPPAGLITKNTSLNFTWTATNAQANLSCNLTINSIVNQSYVQSLNNTATNYSVNSFTDGSYNWNVTCTDGSNVNTSATRTFVIDTTPPAITFVTPTPDSGNLTNRSFVYINVTMNENISVALLDFNGTNYTMTSATPTRFFLNLTSITNGTYFYRVYANDTAGNLNVSELRNITFNISSADIVAPGIFNVSTHNITNQSAFVNFTTDEAGNTTVRYGTTQALGSSVGNSSFNTTHDIQLTGLLNNTFYYYNVTSCDASGNCNTSGPRNFTTLNNTLDTTPPTVTIISPEATVYTNTSVFVNISATDNVAISRIYYMWNDSLGNVSANITWTSSHFQNFSDNTTVTIRAYANDTANNIGNSSLITFLINVSAAPDNSSPNITSVTAINITNQSAVISWATDEASNSTVNYGTNTTLGTFVLNATRVTAHNISVPGLLNNTLYFYNVTSCDRAGNCNTSGPRNFTTLNNTVDTTAPAITLSVPANGTTITSSTQAFTWTAVDDHHVTLYCNVTINGSVNISTTATNGTAHSDTISLSNGTYSWNVTCADGSGNRNTSETRTFFVNISGTPPAPTGGGGGGGGCTNNCYVPPVVNKTPPACTPNWHCVNVGGCIGGLQRRTCIDLASCNDTLSRPSSVIICEELPPVPPVEETPKGPPVIVVQEPPAPPVVPFVAPTTPWWQTVLKIFEFIGLLALMSSILGLIGIGALTLIRRRKEEDDYFRGFDRRTHTTYLPYEFIDEARVVLERMIEHKSLRGYTPIVLDLCRHAMEDAHKDIASGRMGKNIVIDGHYEWISVGILSRVTRAMAHAMLLGMDVTINDDGHHREVKVGHKKPVHASDYPELEATPVTPAKGAVYSFIVSDEGEVRKVLELLRGGTTMLMLDMRMDSHEAMHSALKRLKRTAEIQRGGILGLGGTWYVVTSGMPVITSNAQSKA